MVTAKSEGDTNQRRSDPTSLKDSELAAAFRSRASEVFGRHDRSLQLAQDDASRLWLAWRGDPTYLIANLSDRMETEGAWRVVKYTEIPEITETHDHVEARSLGHDFPDHVLAHLTQFVLQELSRLPGAKVEVGETQEEAKSDFSHRAIAEEAYNLLKAGKALTIRWSSRGAPGLFSRILVLSKDSVQYSKYPALDRVTASRRESDRGFTKFLERAEKKHQKRWVRWVTHG